MTWHNAPFCSTVSLRVLSSVLLIGFVAACGSSSKNATISITAPEKGQVLTSKDDTDTNASGLQYNVTAASTDVAPGTDVSRLPGQ